MPRAYTIANNALLRVARALEMAIKWGAATATAAGIAAIRIVRDLMFESWAELMHLSQAVAVDGARAAGDILLVLADRIGRAMVSLASDARKAWIEFWGFSPVALPVAVSISLTLLTLGGGLALSNPPVQAAVYAAILAAGRGIKEAIPYIMALGRLL